MDQTALPRAKIYPEDELSNHTNSEYVPSALFLPRTRKPKKDALRQKKRNKALEKKLAATDYQEADNASTKQKSDEDHPSQGNSAKVSSQPPQVGSQNCSQNLVSLVTKPPYLSINKKNCIVGDYGHSTAFFRRPLIQGTYFLEFTVKEDGYKYKQVKFDSAVRVGICEANFNPVFPLGYKQSIGYKSIDGSIIYQNQKIGSAEPYKAGDTIAVCLKLGSLQKFRKPQAKNEEACLSFYKNGRLMFQFRETKQLFYCFGLSCYNYSQIQIKTEQECSYIPQGSHYFKCLKQKILYKDLEHNKMFKI